MLQTGAKEDPAPWPHVGRIPDQIIRKQAEGNKLSAGGAELDEVCRHLQIAESTWTRWVAQMGGMKASDAERLRVRETPTSGPYCDWTIHRGPLIPAALPEVPEFQDMRDHRPR